MAIVYAKFNVSIHGLNVEDKESLDWLAGWIKSETYAGLMGFQKDKFGFRDAFESDIEVNVEEYAGEEKRK